MTLTNKRSIITLFSNKQDFYSHQVLIVLCEKAVNFSVVDVDENDRPQELLDVNPYGNVPTLHDRDLVLYEPKIILEYLDERFPHPPLLPIYPISKANARLCIYRIEKEWYTLAHTIKTGAEAEQQRARKELKDSITSMAPVLDSMPYFFSEEFSLVDAFIAPLLWRLETLGIDLPPQAKPIVNYKNKIFNRPTFQKALEYIRDV